MVEMEEFATAELARHERIRLWNTVTRQAFGPIRIDPFDRPAFDARMVRSQSGPVHLSSVVSAPSEISGLGARGRPLRGHFLLLDRTGSSTVEQEGRSAVTSPGRLIAVRADRPFSIRFEQQNHMIVTHVPTRLDAVDWDLAWGDDGAGCAPPLLTTLLETWTRAPNSDVGEAYSRMLHDALTITWARTAPERDVVNEWSRRIDELVDAHLHESDLTARWVGTALGASGRYIQMVMAQRGTTFSQFVLERRLTEASARLREHPTEPITDVATAVGLDNPSYFARVFRARFGCSPSGWRAGT